MFQFFGIKLIAVSWIRFYIYIYLSRYDMQLVDIVLFFRLSLWKVSFYIQSWVLRVIPHWKPVSTYLAPNIVKIKSQQLFDQISAVYEVDLLKMLVSSRPLNTLRFSKTIFFWMNWDINFSCRDATTRIMKL